MIAEEHNVTKAKRRAAPEPSAAPAWALETWKDLNDYLRTCDEAGTLALLELEKARTRPRRQFVLRVHSRLNRLRAERERVELKSRTEARS